MLRSQSKPANLTKYQKDKLAAAGPSAILRSIDGSNDHGTNQYSVHNVKKAMAVTSENKQKEEKGKKLASKMRDKVAAAKDRKKSGEQSQN